MMFYILMCITCCLCVIWRLWLKKQAGLEPPELSGWLPVIGHVRWAMRDGVYLYNYIQILSKESLEKGGIVKFSLGPMKVYGITDPDDCLAASSCVQKHYVYSFCKALVKDGLFTANVATWTKHRKLLNPAFNQQVLNSYIDVFNSQAQRLADEFAAELGKPFDHDKILRVIGLETICSTATGVNADEYGNLQKQYLHPLEELMFMISQRFWKFWLHSDFIFSMSSFKKREKDLINDITKLSYSIIQNKKAAMENPTHTQNKSGKFKCFIDLLLELAKVESSFTDEQIQGETDTIIVGGHDTIVSTLTIAFTLLGSHPQVQKKAFEEVLHVLGDSDRNVDKNDLSKLVYIDAILKETLRLYPIAPIIARKLDKDIKLKNYTLKANTNFAISIYGLHRHEVWGPDANEFRPERWLDKDTLPDPKYYAAFGLGRRSCIGKVYAMMSMKITVAHVLRRYRISSDASKMEIKFEMTIKPISGFHISLEQRKDKKKCYKD